MTPEVTPQALPETEPTTDSAAAAAARKQMLLDSFGGVRGMVDSALPVVVFVVANALFDLAVAVWAAVAAGMVLVAFRLLRKQSIQQAFSGFLGVAIAALIARQTGEAKNYFLLGIWGSLVYAVVLSASVLIRRPLVGVLWEWASPSAVPWRSERVLLWAYTGCTVVWAALSLARFLVQDQLYDADSTGWLATARLAMGYPLTGLALGITVLWVRRARRRVEARLAVPAP